MVDGWGVQMALDANNPEQVASHSVIDADLGIMGRRLVVISGIAIRDRTIDSDQVVTGEVRVLLRVPAENVEQSTIHVGLASIGNDDTAWVFATDTARLETSESNELVLVVNMALMGEPSDLHRFSYQVVVVKRIVVSEITGTIRWSSSLFAPGSTLPSELLTTSRSWPTFERSRLAVVCLERSSTSRQQLLAKSSPWL